MQIREIRHLDLPLLEKLYIQCIKDNPLGFIQRLDLLPDFKDTVREIQEKGGEFFGVFKEGELIGMCGIKKLQQKEVELCKFHIAKKYQSKGYGLATLQFAESYVKKRGFKKISLHVSKSQYKAISLYNKFGFMKIGEKNCRVELQGEVMFFDTIFMELEI
ncbi:GNAT family N-acetyltransferase [Helicobacter sp. faydin-H20]|uniref:GNAT family N-acetyltransferase n=1 Tax=Helicobacter anatolicus TaxID=2905874 RepID=UPI001E3443DF|nr:GNAT family N-acetyltransferase [Helicobacter anatolicus]MCE3037530.1 GNAT family N-acetyltransferase [Helicobacter anatolicus]